ncbi:hypothetical protein Vretimale_9778 [Volvox reticuliferus]|uniref:Uncharacterized protein n=1 Tax=Volvox reticuliferus TaxID=1737510 RepID=A0A8J4GDY3_9CHLO|nr:hypothetical protein Vretimale_9778 [Volvox reticuliferus]
MSSVQGDQQGWSRHWEVLDRVGLPDYTPDVLWQADVLHRAGSHTPRPASSAEDRRVTAAALSGGGAASQYPVSQSNPLPARFAVAAAVAQSNHGGGRGNSSGGGAINLHPRLRPRPAKQPANRSRQPRVPLDSALNLQLVENPELYGPYTVQMQEWALPASTPQRSLVEAQEHYGAPPSKGFLGPPRLVLPGAPTPMYDSGSGNVYGGHDGREADGGQLGSALPSLAQSPRGSANEAAAAAAATAVQANGGGCGDGTSGRGASLVSFRIPLPAVPTTPTARNSPAADPPVALLRPGSGRTGGGGGGVTWSTAPEQELGGPQSSSKPGGDPAAVLAAATAAAAGPPPLQYQALRPSPGAGGSGGLATRMPPSRKVSADVSYIAYPNLFGPHTQHPYFQQQQSHWQLRGRSLSGEPPSAPPRYGSSTQWTTAGGLTPRERYKAILERAGRAAAHKQHERRRRRPGAVAAAAGSAQIRRRKTGGSESDAEESDGDGGGGDHGGGDGGHPLSPKTYGGLGKWGSRWIQPLAGLNKETATGRDEAPGKAAATDEGTPAGAAAAAAAAVVALAGDVGPAAGNGATSRGIAQQLPAVAAPQAAAAAAAGGGRNQTKADIQNQRNEAAARRLGVAERAVWQLRQALDELARFSCANAVRRGMLEDGSVLSQVDARILALRRYDRVELGPDGRRTSVIPQPPPAFPLDAAHEYLAAAQSGVAGLEELEEVVSSMRKKLQVVVGHDTEDLRRAAAEALAEAGHREVSEPGGASETGGAPGPYPVRRPSSSCTMSGAANGTPTPRNFQYPNHQPPSQPQVWGMENFYEGPPYGTVRVPSNTTTVSGLDQTTSVSGYGDSGGPGSCRPSYTSGGVGTVADMPPPPSPPMPTAAASMWNVHPVRKASSGSAASTPAPSGPGLDPAWSLLESLIIQLQDSHAARIDMMDAFDKRSSTESGGGGANGTTGLGRGGAATALLAAAAGAQGAVHNRHHRTRRGGGLERLARLVDVIDENGSVTGMTEMKEAAAEAAVNGNAVRAAVAATLEPKHTEQALYFLAKLSLMLQQDSRLPPDAGFLVAAGVDLLLGEVTWLLALLRCTTGAGSPHLVALAAALRAYEMQRSYTVTLMAVSERLEQAAEEALDRAALVERQLAATHTALQRANHDVTDMENNMMEMERDMRAIKARNQLLEETVADLEGNLDVVEVAHASRGAALDQAERVAGLMLEEHLSRVKRRSRSVQVASEGDCSDPRAIPPVLQPHSNQYYPITPCVSSRHLNAGAAGTTRSKTKKHLSKAHGSRKGGGISRSASRRVMRTSTRNGSGGTGGGAC